MANEIKMPSVFLLNGEITSISGIITKENSKPFRVLVISHAGQQTQQPINEGFFAKNEGILKVGAKVSLKLEKRVKGVTGYKAPDGKMVAHNADGTSIVGVTSMSSAELRKEWANEAIGMVKETSVDYAMPVATLLGGAAFR